jgi:hypothetical protein
VLEDLRDSEEGLEAGGSGAWVIGKQVVAYGWTVYHYSICIWPGVSICFYWVVILHAIHVTSGTHPSILPVYTLWWVSMVS